MKRGGYVAALVTFEPSGYHSMRRLAALDFPGAWRTTQIF
jgi:hypothetical protein